MANLQSLHILTDDIDSVRATLERVLPPNWPVAVGNAGLWVIVMPGAGTAVALENVATHLARLSEDLLISVDVDPNRCELLLFVDGMRAGRLDWAPSDRGTEGELLEVELSKWREILPNAPSSALLLDAAWRDPFAACGSLCEALGLSNCEWSFDALLQRGDGDSVDGWDSFRARIDGEWMHLAERRWEEPSVWTRANVVPMSRPKDMLETSEFGLDDFYTPTLAVEVVGEVEPGRSVTVNVMLSAGEESIDVTVVSVRLVGAIEQDQEWQRHESFLEVARALHIEGYKTLTAPVILDIPRDASGKWRALVSATFESGEFLSTEAEFEVLGARFSKTIDFEDGESGMELETEKEDRPRKSERQDRWVGTVMSSAVALPMQLGEFEVVWAEGLYQVRSAGWVSQDYGQRVDGRFGRTMRIGWIGDEVFFDFALVPSKTLDLQAVSDALLGAREWEFLDELSDDELALSPAELWDHVHRRILFCFARTLQEELLRGGKTCESLLLGLIEPKLEDVDITALRGINKVFATLFDADWEPSGEIELLGLKTPVHVGVVESAPPPLELARSTFAEGDAEQAIALVNRALRQHSLSADAYSLKGSCYQKLGFELRERFAERVAFYDWAYPEPYRAHAEASRRRMERSLRISLWLSPSEEVAGQLAESLKHPLDAVSAWQTAVGLAPERWENQLGLAGAMIRASNAQQALEVLAPLMPSGSRLPDDRSLPFRAAHLVALARLSLAFKGGEPSFLHFGLVGDPTPVTTDEQAHHQIGRSISELSELSTGRWPMEKHTRWLLNLLISIAESMGRLDEQGGLGIDCASRLAEIAREYGIASLGRFARAIALRGFHTTHDVDSLLQRSKVCQAVYAKDSALLLLDCARALSSRDLVPVLDVEVEMLRGRGAEDEALKLEAWILRIAPEQSHRAERLFAQLVERGELQLVEQLFRFYLLDVVGSRVVVERLVRWSHKLRDVFVALDDPARALRPIEWLLFACDGLDDSERSELRAEKERLERSLMSVSWDDGGSDQGLAQ